MVLPNLHDARTYAFFFDFDGTLAELAETPSGVILEERARQALSVLFQASSGAVAIVTGREIESIRHPSLSPAPAGRGGSWLRAAQWSGHRLSPLG